MMLVLHVGDNLNWCILFVNFLMNLRSKVSLYTDALRCDLSGIGVGVHQNFNVELFLEIINHRILKLGMMVVCDEAFRK